MTGEGGTYLDLFDPIKGHPEFTADDQHPNDAGYQAITDVVAPNSSPYCPPDLSGGGE